MEELFEMFGSEEALQAFSEMMGGVGAVMSTVSELFSVAVYILVAYSLFAIAKRRDIPNPWMAFVPVVQLWLLGSISDDYQMKAHGVEKKRRKILLGLQIAQAALAVVLIIMIVVAILAILSAGYTNYDDIGDWIGVIGSFGGIIAVLLTFAALAVAAAVFRYIALYDVYRSCKPDMAVLFLLLNIFVAVTEPIFLMIVHRSDEGMPGTTIPPVEF